MSILALGISWLFSGQYRDSLTQVKKNASVIWLILLFLIMALSLFYSDHPSEGFDELLRKSSFLLLPVIIGGGQALGRENMAAIYRWFISGNIIAALCCLIRAALMYRHSGYAAFFYDDLAGALDSNAVYASWKCLFAMVAIMFYPTEDQSGVFKLRGAAGIAFAILLVFLLLLSSKTLIILALLIIIPRALYLMFNSGRRRGVYFLFFAGCILTVAAIYNFKGSPLKRRYLDITNAALIRESNKPFDIASVDNFSKRMTLWKAAWLNIQEDNNYLLGCGLGDVQYLQNSRLTDPGFHYKQFYNLQALQNFNVHNMYLQTLLGTGIAGIICLLGILISGLIYCLTYRKYIPLLFYLIALVFLAQESALQIQAGIVFVCTFSCIWANYYSIAFGGIKTRPTHPGSAA